MVFVGHSVIALPPSALSHYPIRVLSEYGHFGVDIFFVISGFLITGLLLDEITETSSVHFGNFYLRRIFRIIPAYFLFLLFIVCAKHLGYVQEVTNKSLAISALFLRDYGFGVTDWQLGHTWSISVEEQFYILWPMLLTLLARKRVVWLCLAVIAVEPIVRVSTYFVLPDLRDEITVMFHTRMDTLIFGCLLAVLVRTPSAHRIFDFVFRCGGHIAAAAFVFVVSPMLLEHYRGAYLLAVGYTLNGVCISLVLVWAVGFANGRVVGRVLNSRLFVELGILSYGIYLWQQVFLDNNLSPSPWLIPFRLAATIVVAALSYRLVERPLIGVRRRLRRDSVKVRQTGPAGVRAVTLAGERRRQS